MSTITNPSLRTARRAIPAAKPQAGSDAARLGAIDALRGIAALYVLLYHMIFLPSPNLTPPRWAADFVHTGGTGVTLFFVLSAFTMCHSMFGHRGEPRPLARFYARRFFRIAPLFYAWIGITLVRDILTSGVWRGPYQILLSMSFAYNFVPGQHEGFVWASWTLGVEMAFYLVFPLIFRYVTDLRKAVAFFVGTVLTASLWHRNSFALHLPEAIHGSFVNLNFLHHLPSFACGIVAYYLYVDYFRSRTGDRGWSLALILSAAVGYDSILSGQLNVLLPGHCWQAVIYGTLILGFLCVPWALLVNPLSRFLGTISYSVYLSHTTAILLLMPVYQKIYSSHHGLTVRYWGCAALTVAVAAIISTITYYAVEKPGVRAGNWLIRRVLE